MGGSNPSELLKEVFDLRTQISEQENLRREIVVSTTLSVLELKQKLDEAMVAAIDWGGLDTDPVAIAGGFKDHSAVRAARERIAKRRVKIR